MSRMLPHVCSGARICYNKMCYVGKRCLASVCRMERM